ncbi:MAG: C-GCAxxG-C-C family protein [Christensenellales bacterium]
MDIAQKAREINNEGYNCSETVAKVLAEYYGISLPDGIATPFGGGGCGMKHICGAVTGAMIIAGCLYGRRKPGDDKTRSYNKGLEIMQKMEDTYGAYTCAKLTESEEDETRRKRKCQNIMADVACWAAQWE